MFSSKVGALTNPRWLLSLLNSLSSSSAGRDTARSPTPQKLLRIQAMAAFIASRERQVRQALKNVYEHIRGEYESNPVGRTPVPKERTLSFLIYADSELDNFANNLATQDRAGNYRTVRVALKQEIEAVRAHPVNPGQASTHINAIVRRAPPSAEHGLYSLLRATFENK